MRTTLDLPAKLLQDAMSATNLHTKTRVIIVALQELIKKAQIAGLKKFKGKIKLDIDLDKIRGRL
ncbi:MAG: type II toxin-antitoxin system VapB family antitoxin [Deltaproteobacteria bacterium]|nr:type II toxin-antitoxin system VapB family antitoxin [Deltaproteobacteria bacterium]